ncbi:hypothetical protein [Atopobium sp. oral taxon 416]|uniref:hypothetical protein n=1 Tax=Atopobium sp. oral taxon 416 TaxID=712157 RepID=UPI001BA785E7|nr:hypothetical protein [Atopobium sp. oral taxon 416]QUC03799.1 hypothetical protein J4859_02245 [Atopobium sp. oral taxon 416]
MLAVARCKYVAEGSWGPRRYLDTDLLNGWDDREGAQEAAGLASTTGTGPRLEKVPKTIDGTARAYSSGSWGPISSSRTTDGRQKANSTCLLAVEELKRRKEALAEIACTQRQMRLDS